jgi:hypothetical protein
VGKEPPVPIGYEAGWAAKPVWTSWKDEKSYTYQDLNPNTRTALPVASRYTDGATPLYEYRPYILEIWFCVYVLIPILYICIKFK